MKYIFCLLYFNFCISIAIADTKSETKSCLCEGNQKPLFSFQPDKSKQTAIICNTEPGVDNIPISATNNYQIVAENFSIFACGNKEPLLEFDNVHENCCSFKKDNESFTVMGSVATHSTEKGSLGISYTIYYPNGESKPVVKAELTNENIITKEMLSRRLIGEIPDSIDSAKLGLFIKALQGDPKATKEFLKLRQKKLYDGAAGQEFSAYESSYNRFIKFRQNKSK